MNKLSDSVSVRKNWFSRHKILTTILIIFAIGILGSDGNRPSSSGIKASETEKVVETSKPEEEPKNKPEITMDEFTAIENGMTYKQVVDIIGGEGTVMSDSEMAGFKTTIYQFKGNSFASNANVTIQNGKVVMKAQFGLK